MTQERIHYLVECYLSASLSGDEAVELSSVLGEPESEQALQAAIEQIVAASPVSTDFAASEWASVYEWIVAQPSVPALASARPVHRVRFVRTAWLRYAAAVLLMVGVSVGGYWLMKGEKGSPGSAFTGQPAKDTTDILPATRRAMLVLGDQSTIVLDTAANGLLAVQGESEVTKTADGQIRYSRHHAGDAKDAVVYQQLITPNGGTYQLTLADGTNVWLNAASSLKFPNRFTGGERRVEVTGEVYFEVTHDATHPFVVKTPTDEVTVLGTKFNVNAYSNEPVAKIALAEGSVRVRDHVLRPGQAFVNGKVVTTSIEEDLAWLKGRFIFDDADLPAIMRQIERWYDVQVVYEGAMPRKKISGELSRMQALSPLLYGLSIYGFHYQINQHVITIREK